MKYKRKSRTGTSKDASPDAIEEKPKKHSRLHRVLGGTAIGIAVCILLLIFAIIALSIWPALGAQGADILRNIIGDEAVAGLEMKLNQVQDDFQKLEYRLGLKTITAPWAALQPSAQTSTPNEPFIGSKSPSLETQTPTAIYADSTLAVVNPPAPTPASIPLVWQPVALTPLGDTPGEGIWSPYIYDGVGYTVAYRTFLQPDPDRPYALVAVVAMDLVRTRLHFVLGTIEPVGENTTPRCGLIPPADRVANVLLATFNGGFKARHGQFGAMAGGVVAIPPREGLGTLVIYDNGTVSLEEWKMGMDITSGMAALRQNGPLVIQQGEINPRIYNNSPQDWGYTVNDVSPTLRSGVGLSADGNALFYFCGPSLSMETLAKAMQSAGAWNAIQLDINNYWVLFVKIKPEGTKLTFEPLLPQLMNENVGRYLWDYSRDYFYLTLPPK